MSAGIEPRRWILVRSGPLSVEEAGVLREVVREAREIEREVVEVLTGTAAYDAERSASAPTVPDVPCWVLEADRSGRGLRLPPGALGRTVTYPELVEALMSAEKVVQLS